MWLQKHPFQQPPEGRERDWGLLIHRATFSGSPWAAKDCELGVHFVQFLPTSWSICCGWWQRILRDNRDWSLGCPESGHELLHWPSTVAEARALSSACSAVQTSGMWPRKQTKQRPQTCGFFFLFLYFLEPVFASLSFGLLYPNFRSLSYGNTVCSH